jgi:pantoate--beta-alanine ligase
LRVVDNATALRQQVADWQSAGLRVGFVPTMGALHAGHLELVRRATELSDKVVVSIFVNPTQFGPHEDFERYPRNPRQDTELLRSAGCDLLFLPAVDTIYPEGHCTFVEVTGIADELEGSARPGHFRGVATVVTQLLNLVQPEAAVFGEKDAQQLAVVRRLVEDLHLPVEIVAVPTVREEDGLALSSRNAYLTPEDRQAATVLFRALTVAREAIEDGERSAKVVRDLLRQTLASESRFDLEYAAVVDADTFRPVEYLDGTIVIPVAGRLGRTRLIDNLRIDMQELPQERI